VSASRSYRDFTYREAVFRICCTAFEAVTQTIVAQRHVLEAYLQRHPEFGRALVPLDALADAPPVARCMAHAARGVGVGPMAAVAGTMAQCAGQAGRRAGASDVIIENGGDIYLDIGAPVTIGLYPGAGPLANTLAFALKPEDTPLAICSSSGKMGHSMSLGACDLATVVARDAALADAAATRAANQVKTVADVDAALERIMAIKGVDGVLIVQADRIGLAGKLPPLIRAYGPEDRKIRR
jgi:ApbE superfamily uncharacterized protein (UPF0280 family)